MNLDSSALSTLRNCQILMGKVDIITFTRQAIYKRTQSYKLTTFHITP